jgi:hypothetical protein
MTENFVGYTHPLPRANVRVMYAEIVVEKNY